jgi:hypothetical protein
MQPSPCVMNKGKWTEEEKALLVDGMSRDLDPAQLVELIRSRTPTQVGFLPICKVFHLKFKVLRCILEFSS